MFQSSEEAKSLANCAKLVLTDTPSGEATELLKNQWPTTQTDKSRPVIWSPASSSWVNQVTDTLGTQTIGTAESIARSPVVIAMPELMAQRLGWPANPVGLRDLHDLCLDPSGWGKFGAATALWGGFKLGKTNPYTSTTGQNILAMQNYAASGKQSDLTEADVAAADQFSRELESCVIHYGDTTGNVLKRAYDLDAIGQPLGYVSAVAVEETSVINYNLGNPSSIALEDGKSFTKPKSRMVAVYPSDGSLQSDNPLVVLDPIVAPWVTQDQRDAAVAFQKFATSPVAQKVLGDFGFRPADDTIPPSGLVSAEYGVDPLQPAVQLKEPSVSVVAAIKRQWDDVRKPSSVLELIDTSGSMGLGISEHDSRSRMQIAIESASSTLGHFRTTDQVGLRTFTTDPNGMPIISDIRPVSPLAGGKEQLENDIRTLQPGGGTPLYDAVYTAWKDMKQRATPGQINAIVVLSDGEDVNSQQFRTVDALLNELRKENSDEISDPAPVRIFPIVYSSDASSTDLAKIAEATGGQVFDASDPKRLSLIFQSVINNF